MVKTPLLPEYIAGMDEVGMGCLAGPLVVCVTVFHKHCPHLTGVDDSKKLSPKKREDLILPIREAAFCYGLGWSCPAMIDQQGIAYSWQVAAKEAVRQAILYKPLEGPTKLIVDGIRIPTDPGPFVEIKCEPKADATYWQVSAASILAKVIRDAYMSILSKECPEYLWNENAGYGTPDHVKAIQKLGPTRHHRQSFLKKLSNANKTLEQLAM